MHRTVRTHLCLPHETVRRLDRLRRGSRQPLARFISTILADYLDGTRAARPPRRARRFRQRAA